MLEPVGKRNMRDEPVDNGAALSFGARLRSLRQAAGLTQEELALRAGLSPNAVGALERGQRKRPYPHTVRALADALELPQEERTTLIASVPRSRDTSSSSGGKIQAGRFPTSELPSKYRPPEESPGNDQHNLPSTRTSFIGRDAEILEVKRLLAMTRLLTLTGAGGCGKTRLALEVARNLVGAYPDGVWLVELAPLSEGALVPQAVAAALGVREQPGRPLTDTVADALHTKEMLLVLDNCEHLIDACAQFVDRLLNSCSHLRVLATSREPLGVDGEANWVVLSLSLPDPEDPLTVDELERYESARLFRERACYRYPAFDLTPQNTKAVAYICRRLDGIPLAIELAAAWVGTLSVGQIASRLRDPLKLLTGGARIATPRQQTLRGALNWSYDLLNERERKLFARLSVFSGGWALEEAEAVGVGGGIEENDVLDLLGRLVDKSLALAVTIGDGSARYRMLEPVRQYGRERLEESGETETVLGRHAALFLALAEAAEPELRGTRQVSWLERLEKEQDNLRAAIAWLLETGRSEQAARLGWALWFFWWIRGRFTEGRRWIEGVLSRGPAMPASARAKALFVAGTMASGQADFRSAELWLEESLSLFRQLGDKRGAAHALGSAGLVALDKKQHERGTVYFQEGADLFLAVGDKWGTGIMLCFLAVAWFKQGDPSHAKRLAERGLALSQEVGDRQGTSVTLYVLARLAQAERNHEHARRLFEGGLKLSAEVGDETNVAYCLEGLAAIAASEDRLVRTARLWGAAEALLEKIEATAYPYATDHSIYQRQVTAARARLDQETWAQAWAEGQAMTAAQAVAYALKGGEPD
jgi:predicted ATPase/transcriptional regulator with XRE-family HTH domain